LKRTKSIAKKLKKRLVIKNFNYASFIMYPVAKLKKHKATNFVKKQKFLKQGITKKS